MRRIPHIDPQALKDLCVLRPARSFVAIALDWSMIALSIYLCVAISFWFYPLAFVVIGSRFYALEGMMHEAAHSRLHHNKTLNDAIGE